MYPMAEQCGLICLAHDLIDIFGNIGNIRMKKLINGDIMVCNSINRKFWVVFNQQCGGWDYYGAIYLRDLAIIWA
jgi:hypothetical protein